MVWIEVPQLFLVSVSGQHVSRFNNKCMLVWLLRRNLLIFFLYINMKVQEQDAKILVTCTDYLFVTHLLMFVVVAKPVKNIKMK